MVAMHVAFTHTQTAVVIVKAAMAVSGNIVSWLECRIHV